MLIKGGDTTAAGTALLIAAAPVGKGRLIDAGSVLPALAAVPPSALTGTDAATVVELADPLDPQTVLTRVRAAATTEGPLFLYVTGQLQLDRRQRLPHLALARTTPTTLRYTALPWHWLASELTIRRPGTTTVVVDLVTAPDVWQRLSEEGPRLLALGSAIRLYGKVAPPPGRREAAVPGYLGACAAIWRSGARPGLAALHEQAAQQSESAGALLLTPPPDFGPLPGAGPVPHAGAVPPRARAAADPAPAAPGSTAPVPVAGAAPDSRVTGGAGAPAADPAAGTVQDPHPAILAAAQSGRHAEAAAVAAAWERRELQLYGPGSRQAIHWLEVRADLARLAGDPALSCELWMSAADARLTARQTADDPDVEGAVDRAHHQWEQIRDADRARGAAPRLVALRRRVPGRQRGALRVLQRRLEQLHTRPPVAGGPGTG
ncbi:hypothetical protein AB0G74_26535 [Streptomyces sp. NPDC020875]|uniref:hypothetical protein n=1 Tax=Streptomyces sp. NPDC020875 TaxID=3154898 RepID=UPI0033EA5E2C